MALSAVALNCTLKSGSESSSCQKMLEQVAAELRAQGGVSCQILRLVDYDIKPGVTSDEGNGDQWPAIRAQILAADILVLGTPIWLGHPSSVCQRVLERLDALLGETDEQERMPSFGKVAVIAVVGNEDGAHHVVAELAQGLMDVGFTLPASGSTYWVGEAMQARDYKDLDETPEAVAGTNATVARHAIHLAGLLKGSPYPGKGA